VDNYREELLFGTKPLKCFYYSKTMLLIALIPSLVGIFFGLELAIFRFIFPKDGPILVSILGWIALPAGCLGIILIIYKMINPKPFIVATENGLFANVIVGKGGYLFFPWEEILDISTISYSTSPTDTNESALMRQVSYDDYIILQLPSNFETPKLMVQTYDFGDNQLGLAVNMIEGKAGDMVIELRKIWSQKTGRK